MGTLDVLLSFFMLPTLCQNGEKEQWDTQNVDVKEAAMGQTAVVVRGVKLAPMDPRTAKTNSTSSVFVGAPLPGMSFSGSCVCSRSSLW